MPSNLNKLGVGFRSIPSLIDLPGIRGAGVEVGGIGSGSGVGVGPEFRHSGVKLRGGYSETHDKGGSENTRDGYNGYVSDGEIEARALEGKDGQLVKHYDADGECPSIKLFPGLRYAVVVDSSDKGYCVRGNRGASMCSVTCYV
jgi:hypothetical protein